MSAKRILLIEPDLLLANTSRVALEHAGFSVAVARDAQEAIHQIDNEQPDMIILELQLAEHNGVEFLYELRSYPEWQSIPIIVLSNVLQSESGLNQKAASRLGITNYCYKPQTKLKKLITIIQSELVSA